jgi:hypothetical protein
MQVPSLVLPRYCAVSIASIDAIYATRDGSAPFESCNGS